MISNAISRLRALTKTGVFRTSESWETLTPLCLLATTPTVVFASSTCIFRQAAGRLRIATTSRNRLPSSKVKLKPPFAAKISRASRRDNQHPGQRATFLHERFPETGTVALHLLTSRAGGILSRGWGSGSYSDNATAQARQSRRSGNEGENYRAPSEISNGDGKALSDAFHHKPERSGQRWRCPFAVHPNTMFRHFKPQWARGFDSLHGPN
jgi:hypothetical protein